MNRLRRTVIAMLVCVACDRAAPKSEHAIAADSAAPGVDVNKPVPGEATDAEVSDDSEAPYRDPPDTHKYFWRFPNMDHGNERFTGQLIRVPSGLMLLWFDTATRATEDTPAGTAHVDSLAVYGLQPGEFFTYYCNADGKQETWTTQIVGILRDTANYIRPRLAWMFDTTSFKIRAIPTDPVLCSAADLFPEPGDH